MKIDVLNVTKAFSSSNIEKKDSYESKDDFKKVLDIKKVENAEKKDTSHNNEEVEGRPKEIVTGKVQREKRTFQEEDNKVSKLNLEENTDTELEEDLEMNIIDLINLLMKPEIKENMVDINLEEELPVISEIKDILENIENILISDKIDISKQEEITKEAISYEESKEVNDFLGNNIEKGNLGNEKEVAKLSKEDIGKLQKSIENLSEKLEVVKNIIDENKEIDPVKLNNLEKIVSKVENILTTVKENIKVEEGIIEDNEALVEGTYEVEVMKEVKKEQNESNFEAPDKEENKEEVVLKKILGESSNNVEFSSNRFQGINNGDAKLKEEIINVKNFATDTVKNMKYMIKSNMKELVVKVNPGNLGDVTIKISMASGEVKANISTNSKELFNHINVAELKNQLNSENIKVSEVNISLYEEDTTFFKDESNFNGNNHEGNKKNYLGGKEMSLEDNLENDYTEGINSLDIII